MRSVIIATFLTLLSACGGPELDSQPDQGLATLKGHWLVINYWAQWCKPCIEEIPELNRLDAAYNDIQVLGVNYDGATGADLEAQIATLGVAFRNLETDPAVELGYPRPIVLPTTVIIDPEGAVHSTLIGPQTEESLLAPIRGDDAVPGTADGSASAAP
ncbi:MAG: TlpA disulfide reductase family protein [Pseudomonadota bacterium]